MPSPATVLADLVRADPARPRVTFYDDQTGERIELSAKVLTNWVSKAANALQDELDVERGSVVHLCLPALHWRTLYWALAVWSVGGTVDVTDLADITGGSGDAAGPARLRITDDLDVARGSSGGTADGVALVTLAALARRHPGDVPPGVFDDARDLATYGDQFTAWDEADPDDPALVSAEGVLSYADLVPALDWPTGSRVRVTGDLATSLRRSLAAWAVDGSVVLVNRPGPATSAARLASEGVTIDLAG